MADRVARYPFDSFLQAFACIALSFVLLCPRSRYLYFLSTYAFCLAAFLKYFRRLYFGPFQLLFSYSLTLLVLLCSRTRYAGISFA